MLWRFHLFFRLEQMQEDLQIFQMHTDCKCSRYGVSGLEAEPYGSKCITYNGSNNHSKKLQASVRELVNNDTCDNCHWDKANNVFASRTGKFSKTSGKS